MFKNVILILFLFSVRESIGQKWVDTVYNITIQNNITYGSAIDFGGNLKSLKLDVATPIGDHHSPCGRPLILIIHGGGISGWFQTRWIC
jgi:carboxylesterase type B